MDFGIIMSQVVNCKEMEKIICIPGLNHIATRIFSFLKLKDLESCKQVNETWLEFIQNERFYWEHLLQKKFENLEFPSKDEILKIWRQKMWQFISEKKFKKLNGLTKSVLHPSPEKYVKTHYEGTYYYLQLTIARYGSLEDYEILDTIVNDLNPSFKDIGPKKYSEIERDGWTPLHFAANTRSIEIFKFIINSIKAKNSKYEDKDINPHIHCNWSPNCTPLKIAVLRNRLQVVKFLCQELNFNPSNSQSCCSSSTSPLEIAISCHHKDIADFISGHKFEHERVPK